MSSDDDKFKKENYYIRVTRHVDYIFPTHISIEQVKSMLEDFNPNASHATRDFRKFKEYKPLKLEEISWEQVEKENPINKAKSDGAPKEST